MPVEIEITPEHIQFAEGILFPNGGNFDDNQNERRTFISNLDTIDLQAVPGSGKTTALLAKLIILEKLLPFIDGSGIMVISHTNAAVNEIKQKLGKQCPQLFAYPNFIGTIQSFVDVFLATPYYCNTYNKRPTRIDNEIYLEKLEHKLSYCLTGEKFSIYTKVLNIKRANYNLLQKYRFGVNDKKKIILIDKLNGKLLEIRKPKGNTNPINYLDYTADEKEEIIKYLVNLKVSILKDEGVLHFDDAYFLANRYIDKTPAIKTLLQKRFKYVFVDEMQDMDKHQYQLLEDIFYDEGKSLSSYQRIGDKNQAIHSNAHSDDCWVDRKGDKVLRLCGSHRLTPQVAQIVQGFGLDNIPIDGLNNKSDLKPLIILYDDPLEVLPKFVAEIKKKQLIDKKHPFYAVGWVADSKVDKDGNPDHSKHVLKSYFPDFERKLNSHTIDFETLECYLTYLDGNTFEKVRKSILNALLKILRLEEIKQQKSIRQKGVIKEVFVDFSQTSLIAYLKEETNFLVYEKFKLNIYDWSSEILAGNTKKALDGIREYVPDLLKIFGKDLKKANQFLNDKSNSMELRPVGKDELKRACNIYQQDGIEVKIGTIHSVKGTTHTATLYMECFVDGEYESTMLESFLKRSYSVNDFISDGQNQILALEAEITRLNGARGTKSRQTQVTSLKNKIHALSQTAKMAYVGFSRPTDLLCFAVNRKRVEGFVAAIDESKWDII